MTPATPAFWMARLDAEQLIVRLYNALDAHEPEKIGRCFAPDGVWHRQGKALQGPVAVIRETSERPKTRTTQHVLSNFDMEMDHRDGFQVRYYLTVFRHDATEVATDPVPVSMPFALLRSRASLVNHEGALLIAELTSQTIFQ